MTGEPVQVNHSSSRILQSASALGLVSLFALGFSFLREVIIAAKIGAGSDVDAYLIAALFPTLLASTLANTIGSTVVTVYHRAGTEGEGSQEDYLCAVWTMSVLFVLGTAALLATILGPVLRVTAPGFDEPSRQMTLRMALLLLPTGIGNALVAFQVAVLNARKSFVVPALAVPLNALVISLTVLLVGDRLGVFAIVYGSVVGAVVGLALVTVACLRTGVRLRFVRDFWSPAVKRTISLAVPLLVGVVATLGTVFVDRAMASTLGGGSIASLGYADKVVKIPESVIMGALPVVLFPYLSQSAISGDAEDFRNVATFGLSLMIMVLVPVSVFCITLSGPLIEMLFQRGRFDATAAQLTARALSGYAIGLTFNGMGYVFPRILLAIEKNLAIAILGLGNVVLKLAYNALLMPRLGQAGIALGTSLMYATTDALFVGALLYFGVRLETRTVLRSIVVGASAGVVIAVATMAAKAATTSAPVRVLLVLITAAALSYLTFRIPGIRRMLLPAL